MQRSSLKTLPPFILAVIIVIGLGAFFWPMPPQQALPGRATPTRISAMPSATVTALPTATAIATPTLPPTSANVTPTPLPPTPTTPSLNGATPTVGPTQTPETPATPPSGPTIHTVKAGENMFRISVNYGVSLNALAAANRLRTDAVLKVGQTLVIPGSTANPAAPKPTSTPSPPPQTTATKGANNTPNASTAAVTPVSQVNGVPVAGFVVIPSAVKTNIRNIYARGQGLGNHPNVFVKVGDSIIEPPHFLDRFDSGPYTLGPYAYLQPTINYYLGSFARPSMAVKRGMSAWALFDPLWADHDKCLSNEGPLACELRLNKPSVAFIRIGSNDGSDPATFGKMMRKVLDYCVEQGVIPIIGTKADRFQDPDGGRNRMLRQLAAEYSLPLWDFDLVAQTIPNNGLEADNVHLNIYWLHDYSLSGATYRGHGAHSITALIALDQVWKTLSD